MARFVELDSEDDASHADPRAHARKIIAAARAPTQIVVQARGDSRSEARNEATEAGFAAALTCYPYANTRAINRMLGSQDHMEMLTKYTVLRFRYLLISISMTCIRCLLPPAAFTKASRNTPDVSRPTRYGARSMLNP